jgi:hypothetical protein
MLGDRQSGADEGRTNHIHDIITETAMATATGKVQQKIYVDLFRKEFLGVTGRQQYGFEISIESGDFSEIYDEWNSLPEFLGAFPSLSDLEGFIRNETAANPYLRDGTPFEIVGGEAFYAEHLPRVVS